MTADFFNVMGLQLTPTKKIQMISLRTSADVSNCAKTILLFHGVTKHQCIKTTHPDNDIGEHASHF